MVMEDYGKQLHRGITECIGIISHCVQFLTLSNKTTQQSDFEAAHPLTSYLFPDVQRSFWDELTRKSVVHIPHVGRRALVTFNSHVHTVTEAIRVTVSSPMIKVINTHTGDVVPIQINPIFNDSLGIESAAFELVFMASLSPLSLTTFSIENLETKDKLTNHAVISVYLNDAALASHPRGDHRKIFTFANPTNSDFELKSSRLTAIFDRRTGLLQQIKHNQLPTPVQVNLLLQAYKSTEFYSGAYLFSYSQFDPLRNVTDRFPVIKIVDGKLFTQLIVEYSKSIEIVYKVYHEENVLSTALEMELRCDIRNKPELIDWELVLRLMTNVNNRDKAHRIFYTDSNGFQMLRRRFVEKLGNEANYYPMTSAMYIEDDKARVTLLSSHSHGVTSPKDGAVEVMLERKIRYDDNRGLGEGIVDNKPFVSKFWLLVEAVDARTAEEIPNLSRTAHRLLSTMQYPSVILANDGTEERPIEKHISFLSKEFPCEIDLVNLRTMSLETYESPSRSSLLTVHHKGASCKTRGDSISDFNSCSGSVADHKKSNETRANLWMQFDNVQVESLQQSQLTGIKSEGDRLTNDVFVRVFELASFNVTFA